MTFEVCQNFFLSVCKVYSVNYLFFKLIFFCLCSIIKLPLIFTVKELKGKKQKKKTGQLRAVPVNITKYSGLKK